jgi:hypothetical protein
VAGRSAEAAGIVVWACVVTRCEGRLGAGRSATWRRTLPIGFVVWAVVQGAVACVAFGEQGVVQVLALSIYSLALVPFFLVVLLGQLAVLLAMTVVGPIGMPSYRGGRVRRGLPADALLRTPEPAGGNVRDESDRALARPVVTSPRRRRGSVPIGRST